MSTCLTVNTLNVTYSRFLFAFASIFYHIFQRTSYFLDRNQEYSVSLILRMTRSNNANALKEFSTLLSVFNSVNACVEMNASAHILICSLIHSPSSYST